MAASIPDRFRVRVDGKFFRLGEKKISLKGVTTDRSPLISAEPFASPDQTERDFAQIRRPREPICCAFIACHPAGFSIWPPSMISNCWWMSPGTSTFAFLMPRKHALRACAVVRQAAEACAAHPAVCALSVVNEISPDIVRWSGAGAVADLLMNWPGSSKRRTGVPLHLRELSTHRISPAAEHRLPIVSTFTSTSQGRLPITWPGCR